MNSNQMNKRIFEIIVLLTAISMFSGCATLTKGSSQAITVDTRPPGATCTLTRDGETLAVVNPTPGSINISKDKDAIHVSCAKEGYKTNDGDVGSSFQAMTFGNILFGGLVGVAIDAGSGAMNEYPPLISLTLIPDSFKSTKARDSFFDRMRNQFIHESDASIKKIEKSCEEDDCKRQLKTANDAREKKLDEIERERRNAVIHR